MPEGHTLHRLAQTLDAAFAGTQPQVSSPQGRFLEGAALLSGRLVERAEAWGKHLFVTFEGERILNVHLGLIGVFDVVRYAAEPDSLTGPPPAVGAVRVRLLNDTHVADLRGATVVDLIAPEQQAAIVARLGPDPLRVGEPGHDPSRSLAKLARTDRPVAELLMDQSVLAGVGNVYRSEVLWRHRIDPFTPGRKVKKSSWLLLWEDLVDLMPIGVSFGQIITLEEQVTEAKAMLAELAEGAGSRPRGASGRHTWSIGRVDAKASVPGCRPDPPGSGARPMSGSARSRGSTPSTSARASRARGAPAESALNCWPDATSSGAAVANVGTDRAGKRPRRAAVRHHATPRDQATGGQRPDHCRRSPKALIADVCRERTSQPTGRAPEHTGRGSRWVR